MELERGQATHRSGGMQGGGRVRCVDLLGESGNVRSPFGFGPEGSLSQEVEREETVLIQGY